MEHRATGVASEALTRALRGEVFAVRDLQRGIEEAPSRQTIYRVLKQLASDGWLEPDGREWRPGPRAELLGDADTDREQRGFSLSADDLL